MRMAGILKKKNKQKNQKKMYKKETRPPKLK